MVQFMIGSFLLKAPNPATLNGKLPVHWLRHRPPPPKDPRPCKRNKTGDMQDTQNITAFL